MKSQNITQILTFIFSYMLLFSANAISDDFVTIGTGNISGVYYPAGSSICRFINKTRHEHGTRCSVAATSGSAYNIDHLIKENLTFAIIQSDLQYKNYYGEDIYEGRPNKKLRAIMSLHDDAFTIVTRKNSQIKTFDDLKHKKIYIGNEGSGSRLTMQILMKFKKWQDTDIADMQNFESHSLPEALCGGEVDAVIYSSGNPNGIVQEIASLCDASIIPAEGEEIDQLVKEYAYYSKAIIPGGLYAGNPYDINTFGFKSTLVTIEDTKNKVVYDLVKSIFMNFDAFKKTLPVFRDLNMNKMIQDGNSAPLHKGAEKFYKEKGMI